MRLRRVIMIRVITLYIYYVYNVYNELKLKWIIADEIVGYFYTSLNNKEFFITQARKEKIDVDFIIIYASNYSL